MYKVTITKHRQVIFHDENVEMEVAIILLLGTKQYMKEGDGLNIHINKYVDGQLDPNFSLADLFGNY